LHEVALDFEGIQELGDLARQTLDQQIQAAVLESRPEGTCVTAFQDWIQKDAFAFLLQSLMASSSVLGQR
jgi:hypothetical protein